MAHKVEVKVPYSEVGKTDVIFIIRDDNSKIGTLKISKGGVVWASKSKKYGNMIPWKKFDRVMIKNSSSKEKN